MIGRANGDFVFFFAGPPVGLNFRALARDFLPELRRPALFNANSPGGGK